MHSPQSTCPSEAAHAFFSGGTRTRHLSYLVPSATTYGTAENSPRPRGYMVLAASSPMLSGRALNRRRRQKPLTANIDWKQSQSMPGRCWSTYKRRRRNKNKYGKEAAKCVSGAVFHERKKKTGKALYLLFAGYGNFPILRRPDHGRARNNAIVMPSFSKYPV